MNPNDQVPADTRCNCAYQFGRPVHEGQCASLRRRTVTTASSGVNPPYPFTETPPTPQEDATPETDAFMTQIDDAEVDLGQIEAKLKDMERRAVKAERELAEAKAACNHRSFPFEPPWLEGDVIEWPIAAQHNYAGYLANQYLHELASMRDKLAKADLAARLAEESARVDWIAQNTHEVGRCEMRYDTKGNAVQWSISGPRVSCFRQAVDDARRAEG